MRKVIDAILYNGEENILDLRIQELNSVVDEFWIIEGNCTFTGQPKDLVFEDQAHLRKWPISKIRYFPFRPSTNTISINPWVNEVAQRNYIATIVDKCNPEDLILYSDVDEIPRPEAIETARSDVWSDYFGFELSVHYLKFNFKMIEPAVLANSVTTIGFSKRHLDLYSAQEMRIGIRDRSIEARILENSGWHFSYMMDENLIKNKIRSFSHQEFNTPEFMESLSVQRILRNKQDLFLRDGYIWDFCPIKTLPKTIRDNPRKYHDLLVRRCHWRLFDSLRSTMSLASNHDTDGLL